MKHPLSSFGYYGDAADFDQQGIDNVSADFSMTNEVNASDDFGKHCEYGDFGSYFSEGEYGEGFEGYGSTMGFFKKPKIKVNLKKPFKSISRITAPVLKPIQSVAAPVLKPIQSVAAPVLKPVTQTLGPVVSPISPILKPVVAAATAVAIPQLTQQISKILEKKEEKKFEQKAPHISTEAVKESQAVVMPAQDTSVVVDATEAKLQQLMKQEPVKTNHSYCHPLLLVNRKFKNAELSGFLDDFISKAKKTISKEGQKVIDKNKDKIIQAATTQATNIIGKQLDSLSKKNPKAEAAISKVVATATQAATAQAQSSITEKAKEVFEQNKKYILLAGGGALALIALSMYMKKKA